DNQSSRHKAWSPSSLPARRSNAAARSRNTGSTPRGYPFKLKAATASLAVASKCAAPVFCGRAAGADAPKLVHGNHSEVRLSVSSPRSNLPLLRAEDRATQGCDPSADCEWINGRSGCCCGSPASLLPVSPQSDKSIELTVVLVGLKIHWPLAAGPNQCA